MDRAGALELVRAARRFFIKAGQETLRFDRPLSEDQASTYLVHDDGLMRVPVLIRDDLLVRGYTEELYTEALGHQATAKGESR